MRHTKFIVVVFLFLFKTPTLQAQTLIASCGSQFSDQGGEVSNYLDNEVSDWLICPDTATEYLVLEFTHVNIQIATDAGLDSTGCHDVLYIYDGMDDSAPMIGSFCGEESGDGGKAFFEYNNLKVGDTFKPKSASGCFYIRFESDNTENLSGWRADISCCVPTSSDGVTDGVDLPLATNYGRTLNFELDNTCVRNGRLSDFSSFNPVGESCFSAGLTLPFRSYYAFQANGNGGFAELGLTEIDSVGDMELIVFGPVELDSTGTIYEGGFINFCSQGNDETTIFFNAGPNQTYILAVGTELAGRTAISTLPETVALGGALPVELSYYNLKNDRGDVQLSWTTSLEINNSGFEIYRSYDGRSFDNIGWVDASKSDKNELDYTFMDQPKVNGVVYYYISQVDQDGKRKDYKVLQTYIDSKTAFNTYPNPSREGFTIELAGANEENVLIEIFDHVGQLKVQTYQPNHSYVSTRDLEPGLYIIKVTVDSYTYSRQQLLLK